MGLPAVAIAGGHKEFAIAVLPCIVVWMLGFAPMRKKAAELAPEDRVPPRGLPLWIPLLMGLGGFLAPLWLVSPLGGWVAAAWLLPGGTIALRWLISVNLDIPVHRKTWGGILVGLSAGIVWLFIIFLIVVGSMGA